MYALYSVYEKGIVEDYMARNKVTVAIVINIRRRKKNKVVVIWRWTKKRQNNLIAIS